MDNLYFVVSDAIPAYSSVFMMAQQSEDFNYLDSQASGLAGCCVYRQSKLDIGLSTDKLLST